MKKYCLLTALVFSIAVSQTAFSLPQGSPILAKANTLLAAHQWEQTRTELTKILSSKTLSTNDRASALLMLGQSYQEENLFEKARQEYTKIVKNSDFPLASRIAAQQQIGETYFSQRNFPKSRKAFVNALNMGETSDTPLAIIQSRIIKSYENQGMTVEASKAQTQFLAQNMQKAGEFSQKREFASARNRFEAVLLNPLPETKASFTNTVRLKIAQTYLAEGNTTQAETKHKELVNTIERTLLMASTDDFNDYLTLDFLLQSTQLSLTDCYIKSGQTEQARTLLNTLLAIPGLAPHIRTKATQNLATLDEK